MLKMNEVVFVVSHYVYNESHLSVLRMKNKVGEYMIFIITYAYISRQTLLIKMYHRMSNIIPLST